MTPTTTDPIAVDTALEKLYIEAQTLSRDLAVVMISVHRTLGETENRARGARRWPTRDDAAIEKVRTMTTDHYGRPIGKLINRLDTILAALAANAAAASPLEALYNAKPWTRFMVAQHIHKGMGCSTCNKRGIPTRFDWLPQMSGMDEAAALALLGSQGHTLCTVCFPGAPVLPPALDPKYCAGSGEAPTSINRRYRTPFGPCPTCGENVNVTTYGVTRKHRKPTTA
jgi:hypothetical protein